MKIILGSQSPRRRELLAGLDIPFTAINIHADESYPSSLQKGDIPEYIACEKARAYSCQLKEDELLITADTIVWLDGEVLGKPKNEQEACRMLHQLSGRTHQVYTGVCFMTAQGITERFSDQTDVTFKELTEEEIADYVQRYKPLDKAGAYGVQEWIGYIAVTGLKGSYFNVMGFPINRVYEVLKRHIGTVL
ncbi:MAG: Maf-like protein [Paludibacteraceae bacterium]|nr:Maf-like protein [Paludibacteraceae bacterium]